MAFHLIRHFVTPSPPGEGLGAGDKVTVLTQQPKKRFNEQQAAKVGDFPALPRFIAAFFA